MKKILWFICLGLSLAGCQAGEPGGAAAEVVATASLAEEPADTSTTEMKEAKPPAAAEPEPGTLDDLTFPLPANPDLDHARLLTTLAFPWNEGGGEQLRQIRESGDPRFIAGLIDCLRYRRDLAGEIIATLQHLAGQEVEGDWYEWQEWAGKHPQIPNFEGYPAWKADLFAQIDPDFRRFVYEGMKIAPGSRPEEIVWGGVHVDGIPALDNPKMIDPAGADYLVPYERVFGVSLNGDSRAYPARFLDWHEMVNDVVGGEPVSLAY